MSLEAVPHIHLDAQGVAWIDDTNIKVIEVVLDKIAYGWSPEEIHLQHPRLSLAQIHAAFTYYYDHQAVLDADIERRYQRVRQLKAQSAEQPSRQELEARLKQKARKSA